MKIIKESYENFIKRRNEDITDSPLAEGIKKGEISYYEILDDENVFINSFEVFDLDNNWLSLNVHNKISLIDDEKIMNLILSELKKQYTSLVLRIDVAFKDRIETAKKYGFIHNVILNQGEYQYAELKIEMF